MADARERNGHFAPEFLIRSVTLFHSLAAARESGTIETRLSHLAHARPARSSHLKLSVSPALCETARPRGHSLGLAPHAISRISFMTVRASHHTCTHRACARDCLSSVRRLALIFERLCAREAHTCPANLRTTQTHRRTDAGNHGHAIASRHRSACWATDAAQARHGVRCCCNPPPAPQHSAQCQQTAAPAAHANTLFFTLPSRC